MRKIFLVMLVAMFATVSCQKSELTTQNGSGDEVTVNISAVMQSDNATTRVIDDNGKATEINRCIMEIYTSDEELYQRQVTSVDETSLKATFSINLVPDKTYDFVFWADYSTDSKSDYYYTTTSLKEITANYSEYDGNDEKRDAFFATVNQTITASESNVEAKLYRPFGQVNVSTYVKDLIESYLPTTVQVEYTSNNIATTFNAFDGTTSGSTDFAWEEAVGVIETVAVGETLYHLSTDYIFAPKEGQALIDFKMEFFNDGASIMTNDKFTSIPVQRNYRTNISGNLLTIGSDITVEVVPTFNEPAIEVGVTTVETVEEVSNALAVVQSGDDANVTVTGTVTGNDNHIEVPAAVEGTTGETSITVNFEDVDTDAEISFGGDTKDDESDYDGTVYITAPEGVEFTDLTINLPNAHIVFNGEAQNVDVASDELTFVVTEGSKIGTLTVYAGSVEIYGTVDNLVFAETNTDGRIKLYTVNNQDQFDYITTMISRTDKIALNSDIALATSLTLSADSSLEIEGNDNTITMTSTAQMILEKEADSALFTFSNITLDASTKIAALYLNSSNIELITNNATIIQSAYSTTGFTAGSSPAIEVNQTAFADNITMTFNDTDIKLTGGTGTKTGINIYGAGSNEVENYSITFNNSSIIADKNSTGAQTLYAQAMCIGNVKNLDVKLYNSIFQDMSYPIYCTNVSDITKTPQMNFLIDNSTIDGWCAFNLRCNNSTIDVVNGSKLIGRNFQSGYSNGYSIIVMSGYTGSSATAPYISQVQNTTINIEDSYMLAESYGNAGLYLIHERNVYNEDNNVINFKGNTVLESNKISGDYTYVDPFFMKYAPMTEGKSNLKVTRDTSVELKTNMEGMRFSEGLRIGSGTAEDPYQIFDNGDLSIIKYYSTANYSAYFKQMCDIEYEYTPYVIGQTPAYGAPTVTIGSSSWSVAGMETTLAVACNLNGEYDGNGFAINNFRYDVETVGSNCGGESYVGLFNTVLVNSTIKDLSLTTTDSDAGINFSTSLQAQVGSFAGRLQGTIESCNSSLPITVEYTGTGANTGGIAGQMYMFNTDSSLDINITINNCEYSGDLTVKTAGTGAGILAAGAGYGYYSTWVTNNTFSGSVTAPTAYAICPANYDDGGNTSTGTINVLEE